MKITCVWEKKGKREREKGKEKEKETEKDMSEPEIKPRGPKASGGDVGEISCPVS